MKKWKVGVLAVLTAVFADIMILGFWMTAQDWSRWKVERWNVQERMYESLSTLFGEAQIPVFAASALALCVYLLIRNRHLEKFSGSRLLSFVRQHGLTIALGLLALFFMLLMVDHLAIFRIRTIVETSEVPAALKYYRLSGWLQLAGELVFEAAIISFASWRGNRRKAYRRKDET